MPLSMAIKLTLFSEKDLEGKPALFVVLSSFPDNEATFGLGAQMRRFHFTGDLIEALEPAHVERDFLEKLAGELERGRGQMLELSNEQAWDIGMLPQQDGSQWVRVTLRKVELGDGSFRFSESYQTVDGGQNVSGSSLEVLPDLETRVRKYVALDWKAVEAQLKERESCGTVLHLPNETVRYIFDGDL